MRVQFYYYGIIVGKFIPKVKAAWIPYGGYEYGGFATFQVKGCISLKILLRK